MFYLLGDGLEQQIEPVRLDSADSGAGHTALESEE